MAHKLKIVAVSGGLQRPSRTLALVEQLLEGFTDALPAQTRLVELGEIAPRFGNVLQSIKEKKQIDDTLKASVEAALKEFVEHFKATKGLARA